MEKNRKRKLATKERAKYIVPPDQQAARDWYIEVYCSDMVFSEKELKRAEEELLEAWGEL